MKKNQNRIWTLTMLAMIAVIAALGAAATSSFAGEGDKGGNGGDPACENRIQEIRNDIELWILNGEYQSLVFPSDVSPIKYKERMLEFLSGASKAGISCTTDKVVVNGAEKTCKNYVSNTGQPVILCNLERFLNITDESNQYVTIHHEYAGLSGFEVNSGMESDYRLSRQISAHLKEATVKKLVVSGDRRMYSESMNRLWEKLDEIMFSTFSTNWNQNDFLQMNISDRYVPQRIRAMSPKDFYQNEIMGTISQFQQISRGILNSSEVDQLKFYSTRAMIFHYKTLDGSGFGERGRLLDSLSSTWMPEIGLLLRGAIEGLEVEKASHPGHERLLKELQFLTSAFVSEETIENVTYLSYTGPFKKFFDQARVQIRVELMNQKFDPIRCTQSEICFPISDADLLKEFEDAKTIRKEDLSQLRDEAYSESRELSNRISRAMEMASKERLMGIVWALRSANELLDVSTNVFSNESGRPVEANQIIRLINRLKNREIQIPN